MPIEDLQSQSVRNNDYLTNINILDPEIKELENAFEELRKDYKEEINLSVNEINNLTQKVYSGMQEICSKMGGWDCEEEVDKLYKYFLKNKEALIVRREIPQKVFELMVDNKDISVENNQLGFEAYPNSAMFGGNFSEISGLDNAFTEGFGRAGGLVVTIGFHKNKNMTIADLPDEETMRNGIRRDQVKCFSGKIKIKDLAFVILRAPSAMINTNKTNSQFNTFSGYIFNEKPEELSLFFDNKKEASYKKAS